MSNSLVSLIIAVHEPGPNLRQACENALAEAPGAEVIVVDDASPEEWWDTIGDLRVQYFRLGQRRGMGGARNYGASRASGDYLIFLRIEDCSATDQVRWRIDHFEANPSVALIVGTSKPDTDASQSKPETFDSAGALAFRRSYFHELGGFDESLPLHPSIGKHI